MGSPAGEARLTVPGLAKAEAQASTPAAATGTASPQAAVSTIALPTDKMPARERVLDIILGFPRTTVPEYRNLIVQMTE